MAYVGVPETLSPAQLSAAREAFVACVDEAALRVQRGREMEGMPYHLVEASCFLAAAGVAAPASAGEFFFNWDLSVTRQYLDGLSPTMRDREIEAGHKALFEGKHAICASLQVVAEDLADAFAKFQQSFIDTEREAAEWEAKRIAAEQRYWAQRDALREAA